MDHAAPAGPRCGGPSVSGGKGQQTAYVALLRGVNVGGRKLPSANLRQLARDAGYDTAATYLQTGNLLVESVEDGETVRARLEAAVAAHMNERVPVAVRTADEIAAAADACPFDPSGGAVVYLAFWVTAPLVDVDQILSARLPVTTDRLAIGSRHICILYNQGVHTSPLSNAWLERRLGVPMTSRNLRTVSRLAEMALARQEGHGGRALV
jgi:uncharacterized protein (DUF1697 family)